MPLDTWPIANVPRHLAYCQCPSTLDLLPMPLKCMPMPLDTWPIANAHRHLTYCQCPSTLDLLPMSLDTWPITNVPRQLDYWSELLASPKVSNQLVRPARSDSGVQAYSAFIANVRATMASQQAQPNTQDLFSP
jgi:hypothetical protein